MKQIYQDYGGISVLFIRFNPDNYRRIDKYGNPYGDSVKNNISRYETLLHVIKFIESHINSGKLLPPLTVCYLFYDGYSEQKLEEIKLFK